MKEFSEKAYTIKAKAGWTKIYYNYLFVDPRLTGNLALRSLDHIERAFWSDFYSSIFYVGKGTKTRPYYHLHAASKLFKQNKSTTNRKLAKILDIWKDNRGVVCLHVFHNASPAEAFTREAAMIKALGVWNLTNVKNGKFYGGSMNWSEEKKRLFGMYLLHKCMNILLNEGGKELFPGDFQ